MKRINNLFGVRRIFASVAAVAVAGVALTGCSSDKDSSDATTPMSEISTSEPLDCGEMQDSMGILKEEFNSIMADASADPNTASGSLQGLADIVSSVALSADSDQLETTISSLQGTLSTLSQALRSGAEDTVTELTDQATTAFEELVFDCEK